MESNCVHLCGAYVYLTKPENDDVITIERRNQITCVEVYVSFTFFLLLCQL